MRGSVDRIRFIGGLDRRFPGVRPVLQTDLFLALVRAISAQQITLSFAARLRGRLAERFGESHRVAGEEVRRLDPARLADVRIAELRALQFSTAKAQAIVGVAAAVASGHISLDRLRGLPDEEVVSRLTELRGIGRWSAEWILVRTLGRHRVVAGDLGVRKAVGRAYLKAALPSEAEVRLATAHWGDAAAIAQQLTLHALIEGALEQPPVGTPR
jgi:DNA-3-methyladenine glycosylase II